MNKEKLGKKWICPTTGKKFYDLNKEPVTSPYTGELLEIINTEDLEKEKKEIVLETDDKATSQVSETDEIKDDDNDKSDIEILDDGTEDSIPAIEDNEFSDDSEESDSNIDELEEFEIDEEIDDNLFRWSLLWVRQDLSHVFGALVTISGLLGAILIVLIIAVSKL